MAVNKRNKYRVCRNCNEEIMCYAVLGDEEWWHHTETEYVQCNPRLHGPNQPQAEPRYLADDLLDAIVNP